MESIDVQYISTMILTDGNFTSTSFVVLAMTPFVRFLMMLP